jgi:hypothetical protein
MPLWIAVQLLKVGLVRTEKREVPAAQWKPFRTSAAAIRPAKA